jgi:DNA-binding Xre family transcriptional regulator
MQIPLRYLPLRLTRKDKAKQIRALSKSRRMYKLGKYYSRNPLKSFQSRKSDHIVRATKMYGVERILPNKELAQKTGCSVNALNQIVKKGEGAYYSSGSRPNQTARSWGLARLASSITGGKASAVDYNILERGCNHRTSKAFRLAKPPKFGRRHTRRVDV